MSLVAYVSGHGFGHAARQVEILRRLPPDIPLVIKTASPAWFWRAEMSRPFDFVLEAYDVGCRQTTSVEVDQEATRTAWEAMARANRRREAAEADDLRRRGTRLVLTDIPPFPLAVARRIGVPGVCVANFTWADIYGEYPGFQTIAAEIASTYAQAERLLEADLSLPMDYFPHRESIGLVARVGRDRRRELEALLPAAAQGKRWALIYAGNWGMPFAWERLEAFQDWHFLTLTPPQAPIANLSAASADWMPHPDLVASVDLAVSKPGYGLVGECLAAGTPLLYGPRQGFAEYAALEKALDAWPGGLRLEAGAFLATDWETALARTPARGTTPARAAPGGARAAGALARWWLDGKIAPPV